MDPLEPWQHLRVPRVEAADWTVVGARSGLREVARIRAALDAAQAAFVGVVKSSAGRDTRAALVRETGMSSAAARQAERVADVVGRVPGACDALAGGEVSAAHLAALAPVADSVAAAGLLVHAAGGESVDDFAHRVRRHGIETDAEGVLDRQRRARTLSFFRGEDGGIGLRALFSAVDGARVRAAIERACDAAWRTDHPERAATLGGHEAEPRDRRLSDALVDLIAGPPRRLGAGPTGSSDGAAAASSGEAVAGDQSIGAVRPTGSSRAGLPDPARVRTPASGSGTDAMSPTRGAGPDRPPADGSRIGVVVIVDEARMEAHLAGGDPIGIGEVAALVHGTRTEMYAAVRSMSGAILRFGRSRRFASALQKLAVIARDGGTCATPGCDVPWYRCDVDHRIEWTAGGRTDLENLDLQCRNGHHTHRHEHSGLAPPGARGTRLSQSLG